MAKRIIFWLVIISLTILSGLYSNAMMPFIIGEWAPIMMIWMIVAYLFVFSRLYRWAYPPDQSTSG